MQRALCVLLSMSAAACAAQASEEEDEAEVGAAEQEIATCLTLRRGSYGSALDTYVVSTAPDLSDGAAVNVYTGRASGADKRALLWFDLSEIPAGRGILSASLSLYQSYKKTSSVVRVHRVLSPWTEADATWGGAGSAFAPEVSVTIAADGGSGDRGASVRDLVQAWVDGAANLGMLLEEDPAMQTTFRSSETTVVSQRPALSVCHDVATCNDGVRDQGELGVDCGGPCPAACATCSDGIQNQGELGVDCGGPCPGVCLLPGSLVAWVTHSAVGVSEANRDGNTYPPSNLFDGNLLTKSRYRTGNAPGYRIELQFAQTRTVTGLRIHVPPGQNAGYAGIRISTDSGGGYVVRYLNLGMFGITGRLASSEVLGGQPFGANVQGIQGTYDHAFAAPVAGVQRILIETGMNDEVYDSCYSMNELTLLGY